MEGHSDRSTRPGGESDLVGRVAAEDAGFGTGCRDGIDVVGTVVAAVEDMEAASHVLTSSLRVSSDL